MAIDITETDIAQPLYLRFNIQQLIRRIFGFDREPDAVKKFLVQPWCRRSHVFQVTKHPAGIQKAINFRVQRPLPLMYQVMDGETRDYRIKLAQCR